MKLIVGLGNPGEKYNNNRHNVGFMVINALASQIKSNPWTRSTKLYCTLSTLKQILILAKPQTMMNSSGKAVQSLTSFYKLPTKNLYVVHDDLDIKIGEYKIQNAKGPKDHKGLNSIYKHLGKNDFWHVRVGIENRPPENKISGEDYVLQDFTDNELEIIQKVVDNIIKDLTDQLTRN